MALDLLCVLKSPKKKERKQLTECLQNLYQSVATPEGRTFDTLITSTKVFSLINP